MRNSPERVPSQKCIVSGVGVGRGRCPSGICLSPLSHEREFDASPRLRQIGVALHCTMEAPMITPAYVRTMAQYNAEMNRRLYAAANRLSEEERRRDRGAFWHSLHGTLVHILWGDAQWMSRFDGWQRPSTPIKQSDHYIEEWAELRAA